MWVCNKCNNSVEEDEKICYYCGEGIKPDRVEVINDKNYLSEHLDKVHRNWITTSNSFEGYEIQEYLGPVNSNLVLGINIISDIITGLTDVFGGRSLEYEAKINKLYEEGYEILAEQARKKRANAIVALKVDIDEFAGKGKAMLMVSMIGTAVKIKVEKNNNSIQSQEKETL